MIMAITKNLGTALIMLFFCLWCSQITFGQSGGLSVTLSDGPGWDRVTKYVYTSGSATFVCFAPQVVASSVISHSSISQAAVAVVSATGHGIHEDAGPIVTFTGGTGNWAALNGNSYPTTYINANSFSIPVNTSAFGAITGTIVIRSTAARLTQPVWTVQRSLTNGDGSPKSAIWAYGGANLICNDRATLSYQ